MERRTWWPKSSIFITLIWESRQERRSCGLPMGSGCGCFNALDTPSQSPRSKGRLLVPNVNQSKSPTSPPPGLIKLPNLPPTLLPRLPFHLDLSRHFNPSSRKSNNNKRREYRNNASQERNGRDMAAQRRRPQLPSFGPMRTDIRISYWCENMYSRRIWYTCR